MHGYGRIYTLNLIRQDFPNEVEHLLLNVAMNQGAIVLQHRLADEERQRTERLATQLRALGIDPDA